MSYNTRITNKPYAARIQVTSYKIVRQEHRVAIEGENWQIWPLAGQEPCIFSCVHLFTLSPNCNKTIISINLLCTTLSRLVQKPATKWFLGTGLSQLLWTSACMPSKTDTEEIVFIDIKKELITLHNFHAFVVAHVNPPLFVTKQE